MAEEAQPLKVAPIGINRETTMKVLGVSGSPRKGGNTEILINEMFVPGSSYWNVAIGREKGAVLDDQEGLETVKTLARNMMFLLRKLGQ